MPIFLANFETLDGKRSGAGIVRNELLHDLGQLLGGLPLSSLADAYRNWPALEAALSVRRPDLGPGLALKDLRLMPPSLEPSAIYFAGFNYRDHVANMTKKFNIPVQPDPRVHGLKPWHGLKPRNSLCGSGAIVELPTDSVDWEVELAVVIGREARRIPVADALSCVAGYTVGIDFSARDLAFRPHTPVESVARMDWIMQKGQQGFCPLGPWLAPRAAVPDPQNLDLKLSVNGVLKQDSNTREMIFSVAEAIAHLSDIVTLSPGDVILTGTPAGTGAETGEYLKPGDVVTAWIESIGEISVRTTAWAAPRFY